MTWNTDISAAPRGKTVTRTVKTKDGIKEVTEVIPERVWLASACGKVIPTYWVESRKNWAGFQDTPPIAWYPYFVPVHPFQESPRKAAEAVAEMPASTDATVASGLVEADKAEAVAGVLGQPEMIPALTAQHGGVNVNGPERAGVTGGESAATHSPEMAHETMGGTGDDCSFGNRGVWPPQDGASSSRGNDSLSVVTAGKDRQPISEGCDGEQSTVKERRAVSGKGTSTATEGETNPAADTLGSQDEAGLQDVRRDTSSMSAVPPCGPKHEVICGQQSGRHEDEAGSDPGGNSEVRATLRELPREAALGRTTDGIAGETATHFMLDDVGGGA